MPRHRLIPVEEINFKYGRYATNMRTCNLYTTFGVDRKQIRTADCFAASWHQVKHREVNRHKGTDFAYSGCQTKYVFVGGFDDDGLFLTHCLKTFTRLNEK